MINSHKVTKHACTSSWSPLAHSIHHTYHQVTVMNKQQKKQKKAINNSYIYIHISCKCDTNCAGHFTLDAHASRPVACLNYFNDGSFQIGKAIIRTNAGMLLTGPLETNFSEISIKIHAFSLRNIYLTMSSAKWRPLRRPQCVNSLSPGEQGFWK